ncbi:HEPN domain-containing protein [Methylobacterium dankookense]|uniref:HEPN domain-containing protein n=1 Tax=Methylobacterium dankookense TaxID=560405 RepID=A0A564G5B7_9HYPH|nr:HEPN domain-containing protein [Methylobacterium dankookense]GJD56840.1 hypothetical protein IFDJLNFL_2737 [Methylobacterium dankookense]VUF15735.1 hypothetical protein MTDSW087_05480 [Methylobacterium dankookense]
MTSAADFMHRAERTLAGARVLNAHGDSEGASSRAYYAMFHAAQAALLTVGVHPDEVIIKTHRGLIASFGKFLVLPGHLDARLGRSFSRAEQRRLAADYMSGAPSVAEAEDGLADAEAFLQAIRAAFPTL